VIRRAEKREAGEVARIISAAFEVEREFRRGARTSPAEISGLIERDVVLVEPSTSPAFKRPIRVVHMAKDL
jgi:hypothetical protein